MEGGVAGDRERNPKCPNVWPGAVTGEREGGVAEDRERNPKCPNVWPRTVTGEREHGGCRWAAGFAAVWAGAVAGERSWVRPEREREREREFYRRKIEGVWGCRRQRESRLPETERGLRSPEREKKGDGEGRVRIGRFKFGSFFELNFFSC